MKILDLDMDYFMDYIAHTPDSVCERLLEDDDNNVWTESQVRYFFENHLGLSKDSKIRGRIVSGHNESLFFWRELIAAGELLTPFEVVHVDSHSDLGLGYSSWTYILNNLLSYPVEERPLHNKYEDCYGRIKEEGIGDYLLFAIAYRWISKITYCANPNEKIHDFPFYIIKDFKENRIEHDGYIKNTIQLLFNPNKDFPKYGDDEHVKREYVVTSQKEPEVPLLIIPTIEAVKYTGDFDYAVMAQSPNYTPASADFIIDIFKEYIIEM